MPSPRDVAASAASPAAVRYQRDIDRAREQGRQEAFIQLRHESLTWLEAKYMDPKINRGDKRATAILQVTRDFAEWLRNRDFK